MISAYAIGFALGVIVGILFWMTVIAVLLYFRNPIEQKINTIQKDISVNGPRPKGFIFEPTDEITEQREAIIAKNRKQGRDTPIRELL